MSAEPDLEVAERLPCFAMRSREEARTEAVVLMLKVLWESPPVPTMSHWVVVVVVSWVCMRRNYNWGSTYESASVLSFFSASRSDDFAQGSSVNLDGGVAHCEGAFGQNFRLPVQTGEVQSGEQRACLHRCQAVGEDVRYCAGNLAGGDIFVCGRGP